MSLLKRDLSNPKGVDHMKVDYDFKQIQCAMSKVSILKLLLWEKLYLVTNPI